MKAVGRKTYFELFEHNSLQISIFFIMVIGFIILLFFILLPGMEEFFKTFLNGKVYNNGEKIPITLDALEPKKTTNYLFSWAADIYIKTPAEARYWFNPFLSLFLPLSIFDLLFTVGISSILPRRLGFIRQKIEREIVNSLDKISIMKYGFSAEDKYDEMIDELLHANIKDLHEYSIQYEMSIEELKTIQKALKWANSSLSYKIVHLSDGISIYMRTSFTPKYSNRVLGLVYIGAAVLIIIIGLRGLKFIPPTQPSLVLFALGLEFSILIVYAITLMYTREEEENEFEQSSSKQPDSLLISNDYGTSKEIENLLKVFVKKTDIEKKVK